MGRHRHLVINKEMSKWRLFSESFDGKGMEKEQGIPRKVLSDDRNFLKRFIYLLTFRTEGKGGRKRRRETSMCGCLSRAPNWGPGSQPRHVP